jgi:hypothetical protein
MLSIFSLIISFVSLGINVYILNKLLKNKKRIKGIKNTVKIVGGKKVRVRGTDK